LGERPKLLPFPEKNVKNVKSDVCPSAQKKGVPGPKIRNKMTKGICFPKKFPGIKMALPPQIPGLKLPGNTPPNGFFWKELK